MTSINIPDAALNDRNTFGMNDYGEYCNPFDGCTALEALSRPLNMTVVEYLRHELALKEERIKRRVAVLICLQSINEARIRRGEEEVKRRKLNSDEGSSSGNNDVVVGNNATNHQPQIGEFNGALAEDMITAFEMWMEILMFL